MVPKEPSSLQGFPHLNRNPHSCGSPSPTTFIRQQESAHRWLQDTRNVSCSCAGLPDEQIQKGKDLKSTTEIVQDGKNFKITVTTGSKVLHNEFTIGQECDMELMTGEKVKVGDQLLFCQVYRGSGTLSFLSRHSFCT